MKLGRSRLLGVYPCLYGTDAKKLQMLLPDGVSRVDYELSQEPLKTNGFRDVLNDQKKLAALSKASTDDFTFCIGSDDSSSVIATEKLVKANKGLYLAYDDVAADMVILNGDCADVNVTDANAYSALTMPGSSKSGSVTLKGGSEREAVLTFSGNITAYGSITMENLTLNPMKSVSTNVPADFKPMDSSGWDMLGATTITNVIHFAGSGENC